MQDRCIAKYTIYWCWLLQTMNERGPTVQVIKNKGKQQRSDNNTFKVQPFLGEEVYFKQLLRTWEGVPFLSFLHFYLPIYAIE